MFHQNDDISSAAMPGKNEYYKDDIRASDNNSNCDGRTLSPNQYDGDVENELKCSDFASCSESAPKKLGACARCGKNFDSTKTLLDHQSDCKSIKFKSQGDSHSVERRFLCDVCGKTFQYRSHLQDHHFKHTSERPFICNICGNKFKRNSHLRNHVLTHTAVKPFNCSFCGKTFLQEAYLRCHLLTHTGKETFNCCFCNETFSQGADLRQHLLIHAGEKSFSCCFCDVKFVSVNRLKKHLLIHTGEKPHSCDICGKGYRYKRDLATHSKIHSESTLKCKDSIKHVVTGINCEDGNPDDSEKHIYMHSDNHSD